MSALQGINRQPGLYAGTHLWSTAYKKEWLCYLHTTAGQPDLQHRRKVKKQCSEHTDALEMEPCNSRTTPKELPWLWMGEKWPGGQISIT